MCTDKGILAVEQNKVLIPPTWNKTFAWGYADLSCRLGTYESDKVCTVACSLMSSCSSVAWRSCLMGVGIAQAKGFSAAFPRPEEGRASLHPVRIEELVGKSRFLWKSLSEGCVPEASTLPCTQRIPPGSPSQPGIQCFCKPEEPPFESLREFISSFIPIVLGPRGGQDVPEETTTRWRSLALLAVETTTFPPSALASAF